MAYFQQYQVKYQGEFSSMPMSYGASIDYEVFIYKKYYNGPIKQLTFSAEPVVHTYLEDKPNPGIKGSELELTLINLNGEIRLKDFYSEDDDEFQILFKKKNGTTIFKGFLVQTDCEEIETDIAHEISLTFSDQLALLKEIPFDLGCKIAQATESGFTKYTGTVSFPDQNEFNLYGNKIIIPSWNVVAGNSIVIEYNKKIIAAYKVEYVETIFGGTKYVYVDEQVPIGLGDLTNSNFYVLESLDFNTPIELSTILSICLANTGFRLDKTSFSTQLFVVNDNDQSRREIFERIKIIPNSFADENNYDSCYTVIEKIMNAFGCTLFQANGVWNIVRYHDLRNSNNDIFGFELNEMFVWDNWPVSSKKIRVRSIGDYTDIEYGVNSSIIRPVKSVTNSIKYEQPRSLLSNENLQKTGKLVEIFNNAPNGLIYRYELVGWSQYIIPGFSIPDSIYIHIERNNSGEEVDRFIFIKEDYNSINYRTLLSNNIYVKKGDRAELSFDFKHQTYNLNDPMRGYNVIQVTDGVKTYWLNREIGSNDSSWIDQSTTSSPDFYVTESETDNGDWNSVNIQIPEFPIDGVLTFRIERLFPVNYSVGPFCRFKNFQFKYIPYTAGQLPINGHIHVDKTYELIKNVEKKDVYIDTILSPSVSGAIFNSFNLANGDVEYTRTFRQNINTGKRFSLGYALTRQEHFWRDKIRIKLELNGLIIDFTDINYGASLTNPLTVISHLGFPNKYFIFGKLQLNYKSNTYSGTLYEMWDSVKDAESAANGITVDPSKIYTFEYLYNEK